MYWHKTKLLRLDLLLDKYVWGILQYHPWRINVFFETDQLKLDSFQALPGWLNSSTIYSLQCLDIINYNNEIFY